MAHVNVVQARFDDPAVQALLGEWNAELGFVPKGGTTVEGDDFVPPGGVFIVAAMDEVPCACGGVRPPSPTTGEIKRLFVRRNVRRRGLARRILAELEEHAVARGFTELRLDTDAANSSRPLRRNRIPAGLTGKACVAQAKGRCI